MADIKQAAKWMQEDRSVRRRDCPDGCEYKLSESSIAVVFQGGQPAQFWNDDLLADDWEIAE